MKVTKTFENATLRTVNNSFIELDYNGKTHCFNNASVISVNDGIITIQIEWIPKKGELVKVEGGSLIPHYVIFTSQNNDLLYGYGYVMARFIPDVGNKFEHFVWQLGHAQLLPVTPEEQQAFDDFCKSQGKIWNKEKLQWEKYRWKPITGEWYYFIDHSYTDTVGRHRWVNDLVDNRYYDNHNCFRIQKEAELVAEKVKELLKSL